MRISLHLATLCGHFLSCPSISSVLHTVHLRHFCLRDMWHASHLLFFPMILSCFNVAVVELVLSDTGRVFFFFFYVEPTQAIPRVYWCMLFGRRNILFQAGQQEAFAEAHEGPGRRTGIYDLGNDGGALHGGATGDDQADSGGENGRHKQADQPVVWSTAPNRPGRSGSNRGRPKMNLFVERFDWGNPEVPVPADIVHVVGYGRGRGLGCLCTSGMMNVAFFFVTAHRGIVSPSLA